MYKRGKTWMCVITVGIKDGKQIRATKGGFRTKKEAVEYIPKLRENNTVELFTVEHYWDVYSENALPKLSKQRQAAYGIAWKKIDPIHRRKVASLNIGELQALVNEKAPTHGTARDVKILLSQVYKLAIVDGQTNINLAEYISIPGYKQDEPKSFNDEELSTIWKLFHAGDMGVCCYLLLMIYTGMMPAELVACTRQNVMLEERLIVGIGRKTRIRKETPIVLAEIIVPVVEAILAQTEEEPDAHIMKLTQRDFYRVYDDYKKKYGIRDLPLYACRHTTATALATNPNIPLAVVQKIMRHANITTTQHYIHPDMSDALDAVNQANPC